MRPTQDFPVSEQCTDCKKQYALEDLAFGYRYIDPVTNNIKFLCKGCKNAKDLKAKYQ